MLSQKTTNMVTWQPKKSGHIWKEGVLLHHIQNRPIRFYWFIFLPPTEPLSSDSKFPIDGRKLLHIRALMCFYKLLPKPLAYKATEHEREHFCRQKLFSLVLKSEKCSIEVWQDCSQWIMCATNLFFCDLLGQPARGCFILLSKRKREIRLLNTLDWSV